MGSATLTLCHVAMEAVEEYHSGNLIPAAAGVFIIKEAGGVVIDTKYNIKYTFDYLSHSDQSIMI